MSVTAISTEEIEQLAIRGLSPTRGRLNVAVLVAGIDTLSEFIAFGGGSLLATGAVASPARGGVHC